MAAPVVWIHLLKRSSVTVDVPAVDANMCCTFFLCCCELAPKARRSRLFRQPLDVDVIVFATYICDEHRRRRPCERSVHKLRAVSRPKLITKPRGCVDDGVTRFHTCTMQNQSFCADSLRRVDVSTGGHMNEQDSMDSSPGVKCQIPGTIPVKSTRCSRHEQLSCSSPVHMRILLHVSTTVSMRKQLSKTANSDPCSHLLWLHYLPRSAHIS